VLWARGCRSEEEARYKIKAGRKGRGRGKDNPLSGRWQKECEGERTIRR